MQRTLDQVLAYHCGPTLAGIKAGSLISCRRAEFPDLAEQLARYGRALRARGVCFRELCACGDASLVLVYRPGLLERQLSAPLCARLLARCGYPEGGLEALLAHLSGRLAARRGSFPHEIGLFLGYPPEDVLGFQLHRGRDCKLCGHWKVYSDVERARVLFSRYDRCRDAICRRVAQGCTITQLFQAAG